MTTSFSVKMKSSPLSLSQLSIYLSCQNLDGLSGDIDLQKLKKALKYYVAPLEPHFQRLHRPHLRNAAHYAVF